MCPLLIASPRFAGLSTILTIAPPLQVEEYLQYASTTPGYTSADMPDPLPFPYSAQTGERWSAPAFEGICFARSPSAPEDCTEGGWAAAPWKEGQGVVSAALKGPHEDCLVYNGWFCRAGLPGVLG